jgi:RNA polymerase sigma-70 factor (ECF subfamily)
MSQTTTREIPDQSYVIRAGVSRSWDSDYSLAQAAANGLTANIEDLYQQHSRRVYALCLRMTGNQAEAEDLTQEVFIQLLRKVGSFRGESQFTTWLHRLTVNQVLMHFRRTSRWKEQVSSKLDKAFSRTRRSSLEVDRIALDIALARLPPGSRAVFLMFDVQGYNHEEIAGICGCSVGNSKSQLHKARKKLRRLLGLPDYNLRTPKRRTGSMP